MICNNTVVEIVHFLRRACLVCTSFRRIFTSRSYFAEINFAFIEPQSNPIEIIRKIFRFVSFLRNLQTHLQNIQIIIVFFSGHWSFLLFTYLQRWPRSVVQERRSLQALHSVFRLLIVCTTNTKRLERAWAQRSRSLRSTENRCRIIITRSVCMVLVQRRLVLGFNSQRSMPQY